MEKASWWVRLNDHVLEAAVGLGLLLVGLFGVLFPVLGVIGPMPPTVNSREVRLGAATTPPGGGTPGPVALRGTDNAELVFAAPDLAERLLLALPGVVGSLLLVVIFEVLLRIARTFRDGDFFVPKNAPRLLAIALIVPLFGILPPMVDAITTDLLVSGTAVEGSVRTVFEFDAGPVLLGLLIAAAAVAFRNGARLRDDTAGLV
ncbi:DUF2975 domain-containing protein [Saccharopolyspora erythraea]|nr:DUF2975 domain-containing protein [Saccharopolyspora erythraea]